MCMSCDYARPYPFLPRPFFLVCEYKNKLDFVAHVYKCCFPWLVRVQRRLTQILLVVLLVA